MVSYWTFLAEYKITHVPQKAEIVIKMTKSGYYIQNYIGSFQALNAAWTKFSSLRYLTVHHKSVNLPIILVNPVPLIHETNYSIKIVIW